MQEKQHKIVLIGGPSTGKTTILKALKEKGFHCFEEVSREITSNLAKNSLNADSQMIDINFDDYEILSDGTIINRNDGSAVNLTNP